jgi:ADP-ribose pyrophosphatase
LGAEYLYESPWCSFRVDGVRLPDGAEIEYGVLESAGFAAVVPITEGDGVVLVCQWRQPVGGYTLELPGGGWMGERTLGKPPEGSYWKRPGTVQRSFRT